MKEREMEIKKEKKLPANILLCKLQCTDLLYYIMIINIVINIAFVSFLLLSHCSWSFVLKGTLYHSAGGVNTFWSFCLGDIL